MYNHILKFGNLKRMRELGSSTKVIPKMPWRRGFTSVAILRKL
jgi:hypothetical protein